MSGFEIVGLALAIFPIVTEALSHQQRLSEPVLLTISSSQRGRALDDFFSKLSFEITVLRGILQTALDGPQQQRGSRERSDSVFEDPNLGGNLAILEERLGVIFYQSFLDTLKDSLSTLQHVIKNQGLESSADNNQTSLNMLTTLQGLRQKFEAGTALSSLKEIVRFSKHAENRRRSVKRIRQNNKNLERCLNLRTIPPLSTENSAPSKSRLSTEPIRRILQSLYDSFARRWHCSQARHQALLSLPTCCFWSDTNNRQSEKLEILVSTHNPSISLWQEIDVSIMSAPTIRIVASASQQQVANTSPTTTRCHIGHICPVVKEYNNKNECLSLEHDGKELWRVLHPMRTASTTSMPVGVSLSELFSRPGHTSLKLRRTLAVILARSVLHFGDSRWLRHRWSKDDIHFLCDGQIQNDATPYLTTNFESTGAVSNVDHSLTHTHPNATVLALGILLLELDRWTSIEHLRTSDHLTNGVANAMTDLTVAMAALERFHDDIQLNYRNAIAACLRCQLAPIGDPSFHDQDFREGFDRGVIQPLERELTYGWPEVLNGV